MENVNGELGPRQRDILDFERTWWQFDEPREDVIRARFGCSADEYYSELNQVLELPGAMAHDPLVVRRFHRRRLRRRRSLIDSGSVHGSNHNPDEGGDSPDEKPDMPNEMHGGAHA